MLPYRCLRKVRCCSRNLPAVLALAFIVLAQLLFFGTASADPYPPTWGPTGAAPTSAVHFSVVPWPSEPANPANCGESCGDWLPYRYFGSTVNDPRIQDPSNGGTAPQNYVNISSSCVDQAKPSVYYYLDQARNTLLFRWRVEQIANNYATGPNPSTQVTDSPWNSALWTVFFDLNGDGYRDFAAHLNGSSGDPSSQVDRLQGIWGNVPSNQSLDYVNDTNIHLLKHNPTGFVDGSTGRLLNFNSALTPSALWPNGASERTWDYGTSRSRIVSQANVDGATCNEYFVDYQIPMGLLDASNYPNAPKIDENTPLSMLFCTANSLNNPFQKDCAYNGAWVADPSQPAPFGDYLTLDGGLIYQPIVDKVQANGCGPVNLATTVKDTLYTANNVAATSVTGVDFYYYADTNGNGLADDSGSSWTLATSATQSSLNTWQATWNNVPNLNGSYLVGVQAIDDGSRTSGGTVNRTFSYLTVAEVAQIAGQAPSGEKWAANPAVTGAQSTALYLNTCGVPQPYITKAAGAATVSAGSSVAFTLTVHNTLSTPLTVSSIQDSLPPGFTFVSHDSVSVGSPTSIPSVGASGTITWTFSPPVSVPAGSSLNLVFHASTPSIPGTYSNVAAAVTGSGTLVSDPVQISVGTPRLTIAKAANAETLKPADVVTYTITYANNSPVNVTGAVITDVAPAGLSNITPLDSGVYVSASRTLTWTIGAIASGAGPYTVRFTAKVDSPYGGANPLVNTANIDAVETDPASASSSTFINYPVPQLTLQKSASPTLIDAGKDVTFTLRYQNVGSADATGIVITDTIPTGFSFVSATNGGVNTNGTVQWNLGIVGPWVSNQVDLVLHADSTYTATNPQTNTAWIHSAETSAVSASAKVGINTTGQLCNTYYFQKDTVTVSSTQELRATQTKPVSTTVGWSGTYVTAPAKTSPFSETLRFYQDPGATTDIVIAGTITTTFNVDRNPGGGVDLRATVYDYSPDSGVRTPLGSFTQTYTGGSVAPLTFSVPSAGTLRKGHRLLWVVDVRGTNLATDVGIQYGGTVTNTLSAPATTSYADSHSTLCVTPPANLSLQKQVNKQQVTLGDTVVYTLTFANSGATGVTNAKITDTLPAGLTYQGAALNGAAVSPIYTSGQTVAFAVNSPSQASGIIAGTAGGTLVITGVVASSLPLATISLVNQATLESDQTLAVTASAASAVVQPNLSVAKRVSQSLLAPGDLVTYTMVVQNTGTYTATNVTVSDTLPATAYYTYVAGSTRVNNGVAADGVSGSLLSVNVGSVGPGATATVAFSMKVAVSGVPDGVTVLSNTAAVTSTQTAAKASQAVEVFISTNPNLVLSKKIEPTGSLAPGDLVTYTLVVTNTGRGDALNVEVLDPLPDNAAYVFGSLAYDGSARTDVEDTDNARFEAPNNRVRFTVGTLTQGQAHTMMFHARVVAPLPNGISPIDNLAYASASNAATKDALVSSQATAAPALELDKQGPSVVAYPAAKVVTTAAATTTIEVDSAAQLVVGQYVSINNQQSKITAIDGHKITVASSLSVTAGQAVVGSFAYDIAYRNTGDAAASSVTVVDTLPAGVTLVDSSSGVQVSGSKLTWSLDTLSPDEVGVLRVVVLPTANGVLTNSAVLDSSETDPITDTVVTTAGGLVVSKRTTTPIVEQTPTGTSATYVIEVQNTLATAANGVIVTDTLPPGFVYQAMVGSPTGGTRSPSTPTPTAGSAQPSWGTFSIPANSTLAITFTASIAAEVGAATYQNALFATAVNAAVTQFDELSTSAEDVTVLLPQVILAKTVTPSQVTAGDVVTYTITAKNVGGAPARTLQISDVLPSGFSYVGTTVASTLTATRTAVLNPSAGDVQPAWGSWDIAPGGTLTLTFAVDTAHFAGTYYNDVHAAGANVAIPSLDDTAPVTLTAAVADLRLAKIGIPSSQYVGQNVVFTLTLTNDGPNGASNVTVSDTLPSGFTYVGSAAAQGTYNATQGLWSVGELSPTGSSTLVITATVNAAGDYTNYAQVASSDQVDGDSTPGNDSSAEDDDDSVTITAVPVADLRLAKAGTPTSQYVGQTVVFTLTLTNGGPSAASGVTVSDTLPSGFTYSASSAAQGTYNDTTGLWTVGSLGKDASTTLVVTATVNASGDHTNYAQVATSGQYDGDSTPGNISSTEDDDDSVTITAVPVADLRLAKTGSPATQEVGQNVVFTLTLTNDGPNSASGVVVTDTLPSGFAFVDALPADGTYDKATSLWTVGSLSKDASTTLVITATVNADGDYTNYAEVASSDQYDGDSTPDNGSSAEDDDDSFTVTPVPVVDLRLAKTGSHATQYVGENVVFTLTLTNDGPSAASRVTVTDSLPSGYTYVGSLTADGSYDSGRGLWTIGKLEKEAAATLVITATVNADGAYTNYAQVANTAEQDLDSTPGNSSSSEDDDDTFAVTPVAVADLHLDKTGAPARQQVGRNAVFTLTLTNDGPSAASGVTVNDLLPSGFAYSASTAAQGTYDKDSGKWTVGGLNKDASTTLVITATVNVTGTYTNYAEVASSGELDPDSTPGNNSTTEDDNHEFAVTPTAVADLSLVKTGDLAAQYVGQNVIFKLTVTNDGPSAASGVIVSDVLPSGFTYADSGASADSYDNGSGLWTVGELSVRANATLVLTATVNATGDYTNYAEVAASDQIDNDSTPNNVSTTEDDDDQFAVTPIAVVDLSLAKTGSPAVQYVGQNVVFTLTVANGGPSAASGVTVSDTLPTGYTYGDSLATNGSYDSSHGLWTVGSLIKDASAVLVITATVNAAGDYTNYAEVATGDQIDQDSTAGNYSSTEDDDDSFVVTPVPVADLRLVKTGSPAVQYVGQNVVFTLTVANDGPSAASGVTVSDTLPTGYTYMGSAATNGSYDSGSGLWTLGGLNAGGSAGLVLTATVNAAGNYTNYAQVAHSGEFDPDSQAGDDSSGADDDDTFAVTPVAVVDLQLAKAGSSAAPYVGGTMVFTLTLTNDGPSAASSTAVSDILPSGFTYVAALASAGSYDSGSGLWTVGGLNAGASATLVLTTTVNAGGSYTNYAEVASCGQIDRDSTPGNNSTAEDDNASFVAIPVPVVDLSLVKSGAPLAPIIGKTVVFSLTVANAGPSTATDITVRDLLPNGYAFVTSQASAGGYSDSIWTLGSLNAGAAATLQITATVNGAGGYVNYAEIAACGQVDIDSMPGNNSTTEDDDDSVTVVPVTTATIGNYVWLDANQDGVQGAGEGGVAGVMVQLFRAGNTLVASKLTDGAGKYEFADLQPGDYYLQFTPPSGYVVTLLDAPVALDTADNDAGADGKTPVTNLASGEIDFSWDLGLVLPAAPAAIGDKVWLDTNMDGLQDAGESGVPGVVVQLFKTDNTPVAAMATDAAGHYLFSNLSAGDYYVLFTPPAGYSVSPANASSETGNDAATGGTLDSDAGTDGKTPITNLAAGETDSTWDFGLYLPAQPGKLGGEVWLDTVQDGIQGAAESGVAGVSVQLYHADNTLVANTLTDAAGDYLFANLPLGEYFVQIVPPTGYLFTTQDATGETGSDPATGGSGDSDAGPDGKMPVTNLAAGETDLTWDGGIYLPTPPAAIGSYVWLDVNHDGIQDASETGVAGVAVELFDQTGGLLTSAHTDAAGRYLFANLPPGAYYLHFVLPAGYTISPLNAAGGDATGDAVDSDADLVTGLTAPFSLAAGEQSLHWGMGLVLPAAPASLGDRVWLDTNHDGVQDITEQGVPAVTVHLLDTRGALIKSTVTGESGKYTFDNLPAGDYTLQFVPPAGYSLTRPDVLADFADSDADPATGRTVTFTMASGQRNPTLDAGLYLPEPPVSIGHLVWYDSDHDGVQDGGETGVPGVTVMIYRADGTFVGAGSTDNTGSYRFDRLPAGDYYIRFAPPAQYTISPQDAGTDDALDSDVNPLTGKTAAVTFSPGVADLAWDMGLYLPASPSVFSGDTWIDINNNGIQEAGEPPVADVVVKLFDAGDQPTADGTLLAETKTAADGSYEFDNLAQGAYYLAFVPKSGYVAALADVGSDNFDSDANAVTGRTAVYALAAGERANSVSAGYVPLLSVGDLVFNDFRNNGIYEPVEDDGVDGVTVNIYRDVDGDGVLSAGDGAPVATTITDNGGRYLFTGLTPGDYVVELDDSNFAENGLIRMFASSLSSRNAAVEPITDPDNDVDGDDNGYDSHAPDGGVDIVSRAISLAFNAEPVTDGDLNPSSNLSLDFGIYDPTVGNRVWLDRDMDGVQDEGEPGIAGVVMNIYLDSNTNGVLDEHDRYLRSLTTNADGVYLFTFLAPGDYLIQVAPANFQSGGVLVGWHPAAGGSDPDDDINTDSNGIADAYGGVSALAITLTSGGEPIDDGDTDEFTNLTVDFGFWPDPSTLGDYVWWDYNKDGLQDVGELPVAGVTVTLYSAAAGAGAQALAETKTDQQGKYLFSGLLPGTYYIQFTMPPQYGITRFQAGGSRSVDSDVNTDGKTPVMNVRAGTVDRDCDLGLIYPTAENEVPEPGSADNLFLPLVSN